MRAILIDPKLQLVTEIALPNDEREMNTAMRSVIGCDGMDHAMIDDLRDSLWVDDGGLNRGEPVFAFRLAYPTPFAGKGIIVGADEYGRTRAPLIPIDFLRAKITWVGLIVPEVSWVDEPGGVRAVVTYSRPKASGAT